MSGAGKITGSLALTKRARAAKIFQMRLAGASFDEVGANLGIDPGHARRLINEVLEDSQTEEMANEYRNLQVARYEALLQSRYHLAQEGDDAAYKLSMSTLKHLDDLLNLKRVSVKDMKEETVVTNVQVNVDVLEEARKIISFEREEIIEGEVVDDRPMSDAARIITSRMEELEQRRAENPDDKYE